MTERRPAVLAQPALNGFRPLQDVALFRRAVEMQAIGNVAVQRAQARNRTLGIANCYSVNGQIVSDAAQTVPLEDAGQ